MYICQKCGTKYSPEQAKKEKGLCVCIGRIVFVDTPPISDWVKNAAVADCETVEEFAQKYRKYERFVGRGKDFADCIIKSHHEEIKESGYTSISKHDCVRGKFVTFIPKVKK